MGEWSLGDGWRAAPSGLFVPPSASKRAKPVAIDFFCGAGGMSLGLIQAGFDVVAGIDNDPVAMMTYLVNLGAYPVDLVFVEESDADRAEKAIAGEFRRGGWCGKGLDWSKGSNGLAGPYGCGPHVSGANRHRVAPDFAGVGHFFLGDVRKLSGADILARIGMQVGEVDLVVGGPPCQGFSRAGQRDVMDPRNSLVFEWARLVLELRPKAIMMENVPGMLDMVTPDGIPVIDALCRVLADGEFGAYDGLRRSLLNTSGVGGALRGRNRPPDRSDPKPSPKKSRSRTSAAGPGQQAFWGDVPA
jgi:DNA (cytosine-5)-methyltransferase 1